MNHTQPHSDQKTKTRSAANSGARKGKTGEGKTGAAQSNARDINQQRGHDKLDDATVAPDHTVGARNSNAAAGRINQQSNQQTKNMRTSFSHWH